MKLSPREGEVVELIAAGGMTTQEVATELGISRNTVNAHVQRAALKIGGSGPPIRKILRWRYSQNVTPGAA